ncbi:FxsB family cyclophane-forming radical SAM/SPASM peptide maturase [Actinoplanes solisilvae]|uniref:FxsB family cyclophane-forming radical SAM/SPASM peptide maturase n=1 Tax=Actinoplanes solisilvae TaxID=2486853 RepID=UPI000FD7C756|nr:FxsB family cyclophane-forming radical SAM/SPASM peptide maturase [Actinoplanes solisilvae]
MRAFSTFILKVVNRCNIDCDYCYVFNSVDQSWRTLPPRLSPATARRAAERIAEHARTHGIDSIDIVLHGGEPLLAGVEFTRDLLLVLREALAEVSAIRFELQTNATLVSPEWLDLFEAFDVEISVSLDGPGLMNDRHRLDKRGASTTRAVERGIRLLKSRPAVFRGLLAVVDLRNEPVAVHDYLASFEPDVIDFNIPHATHDQPPVRFVPTMPEYGVWLSRVFDAWVGHDHQHVVRFAEDIMALSCGVKGSVESLGLAPSRIAVIESDGTFESTDTLRATADGQSKLGLDVFRNSLDEVLDHPSIVLRDGGLESLSEECRRCSLVEVCGGGYLPHRFRSSNGYRNPSVYCADLTYLIGHVQRHLDAAGWEVGLRRK